MIVDEVQVWIAAADAAEQARQRWQKRAEAADALARALYAELWGAVPLDETPVFENSPTVKRLRAALEGDDGTA